MSTHSKHTTSTNEGIELTSVLSSEGEAESTPSAVPPKEETGFANPLAKEKVPLSVVDDEVIANPSVDKGPEEVAQTEVTMEGMAPEKVESPPVLQKEMDP